MIVLSDFKEPDSVIRHQQINTKAVMDKRLLGTGTLFITERLGLIFVKYRLTISDIEMYFQFIIMARAARILHPVSECVATRNF